MLFSDSDLLPKLLLFNRHPSNPYEVPGTVPGMENTRADETEKAPTLMELTF